MHTPVVARFGANGRLRGSIVVLVWLAACRSKGVPPTPAPQALIQPSAGSAASAATMQSAATPSSWPVPLATNAPQLVIEVPAESDQRWLEARVASAKAGNAELVRVPIATHGAGWGCSCPDSYIGISAFSTGGDSFLDPDPSPPIKSVVVAEGYFDGTTRSFPREGDPTHPYAMPHFQVLRTRAPVQKDPLGLSPDEADAKPRVMLAAKDAHLEAAAPPDGRTFVVVAISIPLEQSKGRERALKERDALVAKGFADAEVVDSRTVPGLFCCHWVVLAARTKTLAEAQTISRDAKGKALDLSARKGW